MTQFKGIDLEDDLVCIVPHIATAETYGGALQHLQAVWDNLTLLGQLSGTDTDMSATRRAFGELAVSLINQLGREALKKCLQGVASKAQVAINIMVRNLFERTADIGFLASDEDIRAFLRFKDPAERSARLAALRARFGAYVRKYSVYSDIIVLDTRGNVLARYDTKEPATASSDPLIREAIDTKAAYVESYCESDLFAERKRSLIYAFRVTDDNGAVLGVLCLCFRLEHETQLIFSNLVNRNDWTVVTMLDEAGVVIASSDPYHIPAGAKLTPVLDAEYRITRFGAMEYVATSRAAQPYQGYSGPGWYGHVMIPIQHAFAADASHMLQNIETRVLESIIHASMLFAEEIRTIPHKAEHIQQELNRSVWNGNVAQEAHNQAGTATFSKILLSEISKTGVRTKEVFAGAISDLHETIVSSLLRDNEFHAGLAIDIMDRNLYERANDCRWWALASAIAEILSQKPSDEGAQQLAAILRTINGLYTVYSNLIVFDRTGRVVAASNPSESCANGASLADEWISRILALQSEESYAVSEFVPSPLYGDRATYIYGAAIRAPQRDDVVGGVAIVFDSEPQFAAMLKDALPRDAAGAIKNDAFGLFVEPGGRIIACSDERFRAGDTITLDDAFLQVPAGQAYSGVTVFDNTYYAVGARASSGYREYKGPNDGYRNDVVALIFARLCDVTAEAEHAQMRDLTVRSDRTQPGAKDNVATFYVGARLFAASTSEVVEAIDATGIVALPYMPAGMKGCLMYRDAPLPVFDLATLLERSADERTSGRTSRQIVVVKSASGSHFGLMVDSLGEVAEVLTERLTPLPEMVAKRHPYADSAIACKDPTDSDLIVMLRANQLHEYLSVGSAAGVKASAA